MTPPVSLETCTYRHIPCHASLLTGGEQSISTIQRSTACFWLTQVLFWSRKAVSSLCQSETGPRTKGTRLPLLKLRLHAPRVLPAAQTGM